MVRAVDHGVRPGVGMDMGSGDAWPYSVASTTRTLAANAAHLARLLTATPYPPTPES